jgi:hypothetical protein
MFVAEPLSQYIDNKAEPELMSYWDTSHMADETILYRLRGASIWILYEHQVYSMLAFVFLNRVYNKFSLPFMLFGLLFTEAIPRFLLETNVL